MKNTFYNSFDTARLGEEKCVDEVRSAFQVDRDRIIHTPAFRSLQSKTQVFWSGEYDFYRTRLTHSLEVAQIGRSISHSLNVTSPLLRDDFFIDADLVEATCLTHDLGHPPFGHAGERTLNRLMAAYGGFEGNAQSLRWICDRIFQSSKRGMNPTRAFVDGILKYKSLWSEMSEGERRPKNHFLYDFQHEVLDWVFGGGDFPVELSPGKERNGFRSLECQIMDWADDCAYSLNDLGDSVAAGFLTIQGLEKWANAKGFSAEKDSPIGDLIRAIHQGSVEPMLGKRIGKYLGAVQVVERQNFMSAMSNRYRFGLQVDAEVQGESGIFKQLAYELVFRSTALKQLECKGDLMLTKLWEVLEEHGVDDGLLPEDVAEEMTAAKGEEWRQRLLCDYIAGLTDSSAARLYKRLFVPDYGSISDLIG